MNPEFIVILRQRKVLHVQPYDFKHEKQMKRIKIM